MCCAEQPFRWVNLLLEAVHAAARGLLSGANRARNPERPRFVKKGSAAPPACAVRTASKAIALFAQSKERLLYGEPD